MGVLEEMLLRNGLIYRSPDGTTARVEGSILSNSLVVIQGGIVTHRVERASNGVDLVVRSMSTGSVVMRLSSAIL
jgi:hypothetical protein